MNIKLGFIVFFIVFQYSSLSAEIRPSLTNEEMILLKPQIESPKSGITIDKEFNLTLNYFPKGNCLAIKHDYVTFFISKKLLLNMKSKSDEIKNRKTDNIAKWKTESERLNLILGNRASLLLKEEQSTFNKYGCNNTNSPISSEIIYLISRLLSSGQISLVKNENPDIFLKQVTVTYTGHEGVFGTISYYSGNIPVIGMMSWWVS